MLLVRVAAATRSSLNPEAMWAGAASIPLVAPSRMSCPSILKRRLARRGQGVALNSGSSGKERCMKKIFFVAMMLLLVGSALCSVAEPTPRDGELSSPPQDIAEPLLTLACSPVGLTPFSATELMSFPDGIAAFNTIQPLMNPGCKVDCREDYQNCIGSACAQIFIECMAAC